MLRADFCSHQPAAYQRIDFFDTFFLGCVSKLVNNICVQHPVRRSIRLGATSRKFVHHRCVRNHASDQNYSQVSGRQCPNEVRTHRGNSAVARPLFLLRQHIWALKNQRVSKKSPRFSRSADASTLTEGVTLSCHISACKSKLDTIILRVIRFVAASRSGHATFSSINGWRSDRSTLIIAAQPEPAGAAA